MKNKRKLIILIFTILSILIILIALYKKHEENKTIKTSINTDPPTTIKIENYINNVPYLNQKELGYPTGCEAVSATMLLKYKGYDVSVEDIVENTATGSKKYQTKDGKWYGANPFKEFVGHPSLRLINGSYGVFAEPIANAMKKYAEDKVKNISGCTEEELFTYVSNGEPIVVWCVKNAGDLEEGVEWHYEDGSGSFQELIGQHCAVLIGYDEQFVYLNDPSAGENVKQDKQKFLYNWKMLYSQAILVE